MRLLTASKYEDKDPFGIFDSVQYVRRPEEIKDGVLVLWGGEDIGTSIYKQKPKKKSKTSSK